MDKCVPKRAMPNARENKSLAEESQHLLWRKNRNATEPVEILAIKSEHVPDSVHVHSCYQASVVDLDTKLLDQLALTGHTV